MHFLHGKQKLHCSIERGRVAANGCHDGQADQQLETHFTPLTLANELLSAEAMIHPLRQLSHKSSTTTCAGQGSSLGRRVTRAFSADLVLMNSGGGQDAGVAGARLSPPSRRPDANKEAAVLISPKTVEAKVSSSRSGSPEVPSTNFLIGCLLDSTVSVNAAYARASPVRRKMKDDSSAIPSPPSLTPQPARTNHSSRSRTLHPYFAVFEF